MSKDLYASQTYVYRIFDPVENKFCSSGRGLYAHNGRSMWGGKGAARVALANMPEEIRSRLVIKEYLLVETAPNTACTGLAPTGAQVVECSTGASQ